MRNVCKIIMIGLMSMSLFACSKTEEVQPSSPVQQEVNEKPKEAVKEVQKDSDVDIDLTKLSSTMVYSEVSNMMVEAPSYVGMTIRMGGNYSVFTNKDQSQYYAAVIVADATACCQQGIEFVLKGKEYPDGYPEINDEITVVGVFQTYDEDGYMYFHLVDAIIE